MKNIREHALPWIHVISIIVIWISILLLTKTPLEINWEALKKLPDVVTVYVLLAFVFAKWLWRWPIFKDWLVPFPDLEGTWQGELVSKSPNSPAGTTQNRIPVVLVVRQSFSSINCVLYSRESESYSTAGQIDDSTGIVRLNYNYTNRPKAAIRDRSAIHDGAASLRVISLPEFALEGEYWTSRCTAGDISLKYRSRELLDDFPSWLVGSPSAP